MLQTILQNLRENRICWTGTNFAILRFFTVFPECCLSAPCGQLTFNCVWSLPSELLCNAATQHHHCNNWGCMLPVFYTLGPRLPHLSQSNSHFCTPWPPAERHHCTAAELVSSLVVSLQQWLKFLAGIGGHWCGKKCFSFIPFKAILSILILAVHEFSSCWVKGEILHFSLGYICCQGENVAASTILILSFHMAALGILCLPLLAY